MKCTSSGSRSKGCASQFLAMREYLGKSPKTFQFERVTVLLAPQTPRCNRAAGRQLLPEGGGVDGSGRNSLSTIVPYQY